MSQSCWTSSMYSLERAPWMILMFCEIWDQLDQAHHFQVCTSWSLPPSPQPPEETSDLPCLPPCWVSGSEFLWTKAPVAYKVIKIVSLKITGLGDLHSKSCISPCESSPPRLLWPTSIPPLCFFPNDSNEVDKCLHARSTRSPLSAPSVSRLWGFGGGNWSCCAC